MWVEGQNRSVWAKGNTWIVWLKVKLIKTESRDELACAKRRDGSSQAGLGLSLRLTNPRRADLGQKSRHVRPRRKARQIKSVEIQDNPIWT